MQQSDLNKKIKARIPSFVSCLICISLILFALSLSLFFSDEISHATTSGLKLCAEVIIPSVFPFIIIADLLLYFVDFGRLRLTGYLFEKIFKISKNALPAFALGILCGFPLGVRCAAELYLSGSITKEEAERLIGFCNNTGPAFLISGVGAGLRGNAVDGIILYLCMLISALLVGFIFSLGKRLDTRSYENPPLRSFSLVRSISQAGVNTLTVCSFLTFFASICGLMRKFLSQSYPYLLLITMLEVGNATSILSKTPLLTPDFSLIACAFAVGFSGFSVHLQALSFLSSTDIRVGKYFIMKLLQGILSALLCFFILPLL